MEDLAVVSVLEGEADLDKPVDDLVFGEESYPFDAA